MFEFSVRTQLIRGYLRLGSEGDYMPDNRWIDDIFSERQRSKDIKAQEQAYVLEQRRQFLAKVDPYFVEITASLTAAVKAFNAHLGSGVKQISVIADDPELWSATYDTLDIKVRLDREKERLIATMHHQPRTFRIMQRDDLELWFEDQGKPTITNPAKEIIGPFFTAVSRQL